MNEHPRAISRNPNGNAPVPIDADPGLAPHPEPTGANRGADANAAHRRARAARSDIHGTGLLMSDSERADSPE